MKKVSPSAAHTLRRETLINDSNEARQAIELMAAQGKGELTINEYLLARYKSETGCNEFKTFHDWKKAGYSVKKGSESFVVWGSPRKVKMANDSTQEEDAKPQEYKLFPLCYLFNESQVHKQGDKEADNLEAALEKKPTENKSIVSVSEYRSSIQRLQKLFNVDRHAVVGQKEWEYWRSSIEKSLLSMKDLNCKRAKPSDHEELRSITDKIEKYLTENSNKNEEENLTESVYVMSDYRERQEARKERLEGRASSAMSASNDAYRRSRELVDCIPFGQPILVGHHSERGHRNRLEKSHKAMDKCCELSQKSEGLKRAANAVGTGGISSVDPEALSKLKEKLEKLKKNQEEMKAVNRALRKGDDKALKSLGYNDEQIENFKSPEFSAEVGFPSYTLQNNNAEINRIKKRISSIGSLHSMEPISYQSEEFDLSTENGRFEIYFHSGKPNQSVRSMLNKSAFKFSGKKIAWVRKVTPNSYTAAKNILDQLKETEEIY